MWTITLLLAMIIIGYLISPIFYKNIAYVTQKKIKWRENLLEKFYFGKELSLKVIQYSFEYFNSDNMTSDADNENVKFEKYKQISEKALELLFSESNLNRIKNSEKFDGHLLMLLCNMTEAIESLNKIHLKLAIRE